MPRITKVYTRTGDDGRTALGTGARVEKDDLRVEAYGAVDELNSMVGRVRSELGDSPTAGALARIQNELFHLGSDLCVPEADKARLPVPTVREEHVRSLEAWIDAMQGDLEPLANFVLPAGTPAAAGLHLARAICRRAERRTVALVRKEAVGRWVVPYLNRLSDALFVAARWENLRAGRADVLWDSRA
ncbi:MAG: cob(I)yrinic acid a,c-diamide adenosyltransferase [Thermoanaerobaculia bacterium]|nr:cob(I)yrinic acid a,c-diamide adenosyltransferase [Thermoanaerobaculia bacterium]MCZ7649612.1 cob(I)yrinic acid a,c-diamide adenosyltransferase [Thermoanaerobaculia bacterium]